MLGLLTDRRTGDADRVMGLKLNGFAMAEPSSPYCTLPALSSDAALYLELVLSGLRGFPDGGPFNWLDRLAY